VEMAEKWRIAADELRRQKLYDLNNMLLPYYLQPA
jgi:hypothetical protein